MLQIHMCNSVTGQFFMVLVCPKRTAILERSIQLISSTDFQGY